MHKATGAKKQTKAPMRAPKRNIAKKVKKAGKKVTKAKKVMTVAKRFGGSAVDAQGRLLPVDYETAHLHDSYDYFYEDTSKVFDEHPHFDALVQRFPTTEALFTEKIAQSEAMIAQIPLVRAKITCAKELEAFDNTLAAVLKSNSNPMTDAEVQYELEKRGFSNANAVEQPVEGSWGDFLFNDFRAGRTTNAEKAQTIINYTAMIAGTAFLAYTGVDACAQYFYDIQYPLHHH